MPEGHTVHRIARDHNKMFAGQKLQALSPQGRFATGAKKLSGSKLHNIDALGKHLFYCWGKGRILHIHLGLYGKFRVHKKTVPEPRGAVRLRVLGDGVAFDLNGPNCCEIISKKEYAAQLNRLGPDPLREDADPQRAWERIFKSRAAIGTLLLNQEVIAGVGNIYRAEVLHMLGISPERKGKDIDRREFDLLWEQLVELLEVGVKYNKIIISDPKQIGKPRSRMSREERLRIYKKPTCPDCGKKVWQGELGARKIYACKNCQT